jgi:small subunit ribosomal protein S20
MWRIRAPEFLQINEEPTVANSPQARKRARQAEKRRAHNASLRSLVRTNIKRVIAAIKTGDAEQARTAYASAVPVIDRMADKGIIHKNKAARHKSRLSAQIKALAA